jgi:hypothetical protein
MRYYLMDELSEKDMAEAERFLKKNAVESGIERLFWVEIPEDRLDETQSRHRDCRPYFFSIELGLNWMKAEFFIRTLRDMTCSCSGYCNLAQRRFVSDYMEDMAGKSGIRT